jgi:DNA end-binding protein Ku
MARSLWTGFVSFGLVSVPVGLYSASDDQTVHFNQINKETSHRIRYKKVDEVSGEEVPATDIVNGYDTGSGEYVIVTREELKEAAPGKSDVIEISDFVDLAAIDPVYFKSTYYLAPRGKGADRAYSLLRQAMDESGKIGIATLILRDKEHLVAIRPGADVLILETMYFPAEIRDPRAELDTLPEKVSFEGRELDVAKMLIDSLSIEWEPDRYSNSYLGRVEALIASKQEGRVLVPSSKPAPTTNVVDLMAALEASVARTSGDAADSTTADSTSTSSDRDLDKLTKAELQRLAADFDVEGRSKMPKEELVAAVTAAEAAESKTA